MRYNSQGIFAKEPAKVLARAAMALNPVELITPTNLSDEKEIWTNAEEGEPFLNPEFKYDEFKLSQAAAQGEILRIAADTLRYACQPETDIDNAILEILEHRIHDALCTANMAASILLGSNAAGDYAQKIYGAPDKLQVLACYRAAKAHNDSAGAPPYFSPEKCEQLEAITYDAAGIQREFQRVIDAYGITGWDVVIDNGASAIDVRNKTSYGSPQIVIPKSRKVDGLKLAELIGHELECHLRGSVNAEALFAEHLNGTPLEPLIPLLAKSDDELFYEGHAKLSDVAIKGESALPHPYYIIAIDAALRGNSFADIGELIYGLRREAGQSHKAAMKGAWTAAYRAMRGAVDTLGGYAYTKDYAYWTGYEVAYRIEQQAPYLLNYATLTLSELRLLEKAGFDLLHPPCPAMNLATKL